ncbi:Arp8p, partial [Ascoidea rubescens DSM 1968]
MANIIKQSGIERVENNLKFSLFQQINVLNQKNYYTDYLKKDDQITFLRDRKELYTIKRGRKSKADKEKLLQLEKEKEKIAETINNEEDENNEDEDQADNFPAGSKTIVIHPGSSSIKIGLATDVFPKSIPNVIAVPNFSPEETKDYLKENISPQRETIKTNNSNNDNEEVFFNSEFNDAKKIIFKNFKERMKYYKRKIIPNSHETVVNFNKKSQSEKILDINDPHKIDWVHEDSELFKELEARNERYIIGEEAFKLANEFKYKLRKPIMNGKFNENPKDYKSPQEIIGDLQVIITKFLEKEFDIGRSQLKQYNVVLIIPDLYDKAYVERWIEIILQLDFIAVAITQESIAATFGAGVSSACVVDIGAQSIKISCVDEGMIINDSRIKLDYGGDDITKAFIKLLLQSKIPIQDINLNNHYEWKFANELKEKFITFQDADIAIQLYKFIRRSPNKVTEEFNFRVFDEVMLAPMGLFFPKLFQIKNVEKRDIHKFDGRLLTKSKDTYNGVNNNPSSLSQKNLVNEDIITKYNDYDIIKRLIMLKDDEINSNNLNNPNFILNFGEEEVINDMELDLAIIESITNAIKTDFNKAKNFYESLLIVGGGSKIPALDFILKDRINICRPITLSLSNLNGILLAINREFERKQQEVIDKRRKKKNS